MSVDHATMSVHDSPFRVQDAPMNIKGEATGRNGGMKVRFHPEVSREVRVYYVISP